MPTFYDAFITQALDLTPGNQFYIPCEDKQEQKKMEKILKNSLSRLPLQHQMQLRITRSFKDKRLWVVLAKKDPSHKDFFVKHKDAEGNWTISRASLNTSSERLRLLEAMVEDGLTEEEILKVIKLSPLERKLFFPETTAKEKEVF